MKDKLGHVLSRRTLSYLLVALVSILFYVLLTNIPSVRAFFDDVISVLSPFLGGVVMAYLLNPVVRMFEDHVFKRVKKRRAAHTLSVIITLILLLAVIALTVSFVVPQLVTSVTELFGNLEDYFNAAKDWLSDLNARYTLIDINVDELIGTWSSLFGKFVNFIKDNLTNIVNTSYKVGTGLFNTIIMFIMAIYIMFARDHLKHIADKLKRALLPDRAIPRFDSFFHRSNRIIISFYGMNLLDALIIGVLNFLLMTIFGIRYAMLISVIVAITNLVPTFGPIVGGALSGLLLVLENPWNALIFMICFIVLQTLDPYVIKPLLFKDGTGLSPVWVLFAIIIFGRLAGVVGMLIGVPVFSIMAMVVNDWSDRRIAKKEASVSAPESDKQP